MEERTSTISSPLIWGAAFACAFGGAVAGMAVGSTPVLERTPSDQLTNYFQQSSYFESADFDASLPNHYPLVTPRGTVPVEQLSNRGLYSQARYRPAYYADAFSPIDPSRDDFHIDGYRERATMDEQRLAMRERMPSYEGQPPRRSTDDRPPRRLAQLNNNVRAPVVVTRGAATPLVASKSKSSDTLPTDIVISVR